MRYFKQAFDPANLQHAKDIVLTPDPNEPNKFEEETDFLVDFIRDLTIIDEHSIVLDFGCGMGRVSKKLIDTFGCKVIGTDISMGMLMQAAQYVNNRAKFETKFMYTKRCVSSSTTCPPGFSAAHRARSLFQDIPYAAAQTRPQPHLHHDRCRWVRMRKAMLYGITTVSLLPI